MVAVVNILYPDMSGVMSTNVIYPLVRGGSGSGSVWRWGMGPPAPGLGNVGDFYLNVTNGNIYTKTITGWGTPVGNIMGPQGPTGPSGAAGSPGTPGSVWYNGTGVPSNAIGIDGDYYLNTVTGDVYFKASGSWT